MPILIFILSVACFFLGVVVGAPSVEDYKLTKAGADAIKQCEAKLPRHLECEVVITAEVKE